VNAAEPTRPDLPSQRFDVIVIGGGVNGVAIARECARGGKRTLILEQNDFASGTSSRSTRIIHGGLRYLEHGELGLVRESLVERERLLREHSHLVRPMTFVLALPRDHSAFSLRSALAVRAGLWLYGRIAKPHRAGMAGKLRAYELEKSLDAGERWNLFHYEDAQCEFPERLIAEWLTEALHAGAVARNHTKVLEIKIRDRRAVAVLTRDKFTQAERRYEADCIVNATGPWVDRVCANSNFSTKRMVMGVRGSHIVLPRWPGAPEAAVYVEASDGRQVFILPWNQQTLIGSTEAKDDSDPSAVTPSAGEVQYLWEAFRAVFPNSGLTMQEVNASYSGIRPLPYTQADSLGSISRKHIVHDHEQDGAAGLISIIGGKLTTAASLARQVARKLGINTPDPGLAMVASGAASGLENTLCQWAHQASCESGIAETSTRAVAEWHGARGWCVLRSAMQDAQLAETLCPHTPHLVAEAVAALRHECAVTLGDILLRRVPVALSGCWDDACTREAAQKIGRAAGWTTSYISAAEKQFEVEHHNFLHSTAGRALQST
jgi:glycerol-3-phosphate dehydrogenase